MWTACRRDKIALGIHRRTSKYFAESLLLFAFRVRSALHTFFPKSNIWYISSGKRATATYWIQQVLYLKSVGSTSSFPWINIWRTRSRFSKYQKISHHLFFLRYLRRAPFIPYRYPRLQHRGNIEIYRQLAIALKRPISCRTTIIFVVERCTLSKTIQHSFGNDCDGEIS